MDYKFKIGDKVRVIHGTSPGNYSFSSTDAHRELYIIEEHHTPNVSLSKNGEKFGCAKEEVLELIPELSSTITNTIMDALNIFTSLFVSEPQKTFAKAGLTDKDGFLTADGAKIFQKWQLARDAEAFKSEVADKMVAEMEKAK